MKKNNKFMKSFVVLCAFMLAILSASMLFKEIAWNKGSLIAWTNYAEDPVLNELTGNYEIHTPEQLAGLAKKVNAGTTYEGETIELCANLELKGSSHNSAGLNWVPIGASESKPFKGKFDGKDFSIINLNIQNTTLTEVGLFGFVQNATILNVEVSGQIYTHYEDLEDDNKVNSGGIVATALSGSTEINNCTTNVYIMGTKNTGGLVGYGYDGLKISNCQNLGEIVSNLFGTSANGGILGAGCADIYNCINVGDIYCLATDPDGFSKSAGGILGDGNGTINNCSNTGNVYACSNITKDEMMSVTSSGEQFSNAAKYVSGKNFSNIRCWVGENSYAGGIVGAFTGNIDKCFSINNKVYAPFFGFYNNEYDYDYRAGGIVGYLKGNISNCYSSSDVFCNTYEYTKTEALNGSAGGRDSFATKVYLYDVQKHYQDPIVAEISGEVSNCYTDRQMIFDGFTSYVVFTVGSHEMFSGYRQSENKLFYDNGEGQESITICNEARNYTSIGTTYLYSQKEIVTIQSMKPGEGVQVVPFGGGGGDDDDETTTTIEIVEQEKVSTCFITSASFSDYPAFGCGIKLDKYINGGNTYDSSFDYNLKTVYGATSFKDVGYKGVLKSSNQELLNALGEGWTSSDSVNGGKPYLKSQYWFEA